MPGGQEQERSKTEFPYASDTLQTASTPHGFGSHGSNCKDKDGQICFIILMHESIYIYM